MYLHIVTLSASRYIDFEEDFGIILESRASVSMASVVAAHCAKNSRLVS